MKDLAQKVEEINKAVDGTLNLTHYTRWEASSYKDGSLLHYSINGIINANSFTELIEKAYKVVKEKEKESNGTK